MAGASTIVTFEVRAQVSFGVLTEGWTEAEKQALLDGDGEAHDAALGRCQELLLAGRCDAVDEELEVLE